MSTSLWQRSIPRRTQRPRLEALEDRITPTTFTPNVFTDGTAEGTLRQAIIDANNDTGTATDTIQLSAGTYTLTLANTANNHDVSSNQGDLNITSTAHALVIQGTTDANGNPTSIIDQTVADRVFQIVNPGTTVTFRNVVIEGGNAQDNGAAGAVAGQSTAQGGGILDDGGNVTLSNVVVQSNQANAGPTFFAQGGGVYVQGGVLTVHNSVIQNNTATGGAGANGSNGGDADGGGVCLVSTGAGALQLSLLNSAVLNNTARGGVGGGGIVGTASGGGDAHGGGIYSEALTTSITASTLAGNQALGGLGIQGQPNGNGSGGGAELRGSNTFVNSTLANNFTTGVDAAGGGVYFGAGASGSLTNVTVAGNSARITGTVGSGEGGGLDNNNGDVQNVTLTNTIVAGNSVTTSTGSPQSPDVRGQLVSGGHNLIGVADGVNDPGFTAPGDLAGSLASPLNANLGPLQNNGGPTPTLLPLSGSPALGGGNASQAPSTDQRGVTRTSGGPSDIGAVQVSGVPTSPPPSPSPAPSPSPSGSSAPSLISAIIGVYIDEVEKDLHIGNAAALQANINYLSQYTVIFGIPLAPLIEMLADANVQAAMSGGH